MKSLGRGLSVISAGLLISAMACAISPAAHALSSYSIQVPSKVMRAGTTTAVKVTSLYNAASCKVNFIGPSKTAPVVIRVRGNTASGKIQVPNEPVGQYRIRAACGKDGTAVSDPVSVVAKTSPTSATCDVTEYGFSPASNDDATFGAVVTNRSPELDASSVELALTFKDAAGNVIKTDQVGAGDIARGRSVLVGHEISSVPGAVALTVLSDCDTASEPIAPTSDGIAGTATVDSSGDMLLAGQAVNAAPYTIGTSSRVAIVLRNAAGSIVGGSYDYIDAFVPSGGTATWRTYIFSFNPGPVSVQSMLFPVEKN